MVTVVKNPQGHKIVGDAIEASISSSSGALVTSTGHGMTDGDYVYVDSDIDEYNGFWYVDVSTANTFRLREYAGGDAVPFYQDLDITYYLTEPQEWSSIFLPIIYKATNDKWPTNTADTVQSISSTGNDNGYLDITASGTIKSGMNALEYVKITNAPIPPLNGVFQIVEVISGSRVVIDAPYTAIPLTSANIQYYYNNYQVKVKIYAGLPSGHPWEAKKPYEEVAELSLTPDEDNQVMFSVADKIQGKVTVRNNTTLYSLPLNLDAFTAYYISLGESYDDSDNYDITTHESAFIDDAFEGYAIAGKLGFKNVYSGHFSDYVYVQDSPAFWLTYFSRLMALEDRYFDISFIKNVEGNFTVQIDKYIADYLADSEDITYEDQGIGVYRIPIEPDGGYDSFCVSVRPEGSYEPDPIPDFNSWANGTATADTDWTTGAVPTITLAGSAQSEILYVFFPFTVGKTYRISVEYDTTTFISARLYALDSSMNIIFSQIETGAGGINTISLVFTATVDTTRIGFRAVASVLGASVDLLTNTGESLVDTFYWVEEICIDIISCNPRAGSISETFYRLLEDGDIRLLEDGDFRITE